MSGAPIYKSPQARHTVETAYREILRRWPVPAQQRMVPSSLGDTFVIECGPRAAPAVVLLHGSGTNSAIWMGDAADWAQHFRLLAVDIVGEAGLSAPARPQLGSDAYARWLDEVLEALGAQDILLVGASLGGWLALDYATRRPDRVRRLVCLCPGGIGRQKYGWLVSALAYRPFGRWGLRRTFRTVTGLTTAGTAEFLDYMLLIHRAFKPRTQRLPVFPDAALASLPMPVLVIAGADDAMLDSADTDRRVRQTIPDITMHLLPGVGHAIVDQGNTIRDFLLP